MEAKQNSLFFNASDIFNLKPQTSRNTYKYNPLTKSTDNPPSSPINGDNRNTISLTLYKQKRDITPKINAKRKLQLNKSTDNNLNDDDIVIDTAKYARDQRKKNIDKIHNDAVLLGTDSNNYITTNEIYQQHAKRQLKKSKTLGIINNKSVNTTPSSKKGKKYLPFTSRNTNGIAKAKPGNTDYENKFYNNISNIFNDPHKDKINKTLTPTKPSHNKPEYPSSTKHHRKNYAQNLEAALPMLNFQDQNIELHRRRMPPQEHNTNTNAKRVRTTITHNKSVDNVNNAHSSRSGIKAKKEQVKNVIRMQEQYEIIADSNIDINKIKRIYRNNGLHIFNDKLHYNVHDTDSKSHYVFNIRVNNDNNDYKSRIDKTLTDINKTNKGIIIRKLPSTNTDNSNITTKAKRNECRKWLECELKIRKEDKEGLLKSYNYKQPKQQQQHPPK